MTRVNYVLWYSLMILWYYDSLHSVSQYKINYKSMINTHSKSHTFNEITLKTTNLAFKSTTTNKNQVKIQRYNKKRKNNVLDLQHAWEYCTVFHLFIKTEISNPCITDTISMLSHLICTTLVVCLFLKVTRYQLWGWIGWKYCCNPCSTSICRALYWTLWVLLTGSHMFGHWELAFYKFQLDS